MVSAIRHSASILVRGYVQEAVPTGIIIESGEFLSLTGTLGKSRNDDKRKSKIKHCSLTLSWPIMGADEVETVSQWPSVVNASQKRVSSSADEGKCGTLMKAKKKKEGSPERTS